MTEDEIRDGAGGGFNERQERASAATVEVYMVYYHDPGPNPSQLSHPSPNAHTFVWPFTSLMHPLYPTSSSIH